MTRHIIFSPLYEGQVFKGVEAGQGQTVMMDRQTMGTKALVAHLATLMGHAPTDGAQLQELVHYHQAASHFQQSPDGPLRQAFLRSPLETARELLQLRNSLAFCGYDFQSPGVSQRIDCLNAIEQAFRQTPSFATNFANQAWAVIRWAESQPADAFADYDIVLTTPAHLHHPTISRLLGALQAHGAHVAELPSHPDCALADGTDTQLDPAPANHHIHIFHFPSKSDAGQYLALNSTALPNPWGQPARPTLLIAPDSTTDSWFSRFDVPCSGSSFSGTPPIASCFFSLALSVHREPLDGQSLADWLSLPASPLQDELRLPLAKALATSGGFRNQECLGVIDSFLGNIKDEDLEARETTRTEIQNVIDAFLPPAEAPAAGGLTAKLFRSILSLAQTWLGEEVEFHTIAYHHDSVAAQLIAICQQAEVLRDLAQDFKDDDVIPWTTIDTWTAAIASSGVFTQYLPIIGSTAAIASPACMATTSDLTLWTGLAGDAQHPRDCAALTVLERQKLQGAATFWSPDAEDAFHHQQMLLPLRLSRHVILVTYDLEYGQPAAKHPLLLLLEGRYDGTHDVALSALTSHPAVSDSNLTDAFPLNNNDDSRGFRIVAPSRLTWPTTYTPATLEQLIFHPADFVLEHMVGIAPAPTVENLSLDAAKGKVAHAIFAALCAPRNGDATSTPAQIAQRADTEFDDLLKSSIARCGAVLRNAENRLEAQAFGKDLSICLAKFCDILTLNHLEVVACEKHVATSLALINPTSDDDDVCGVIDMVLIDKSDADTAGTYVIFDLKWNLSKAYYESVLSQNRSIQLELLGLMLRNADHKFAPRKAYFVMPAAQLLSNSSFSGPGCTQVFAESNQLGDVVRQTVNSFHFRKHQIDDNGFVELAEGLDTERITYALETTSRDLLPLPCHTDEQKHEVKTSNPFSNIKPLYR